MEEEAFVEFEFLQKGLGPAKARIRGDRKIEADLGPSLKNATALLTVARRNPESRVPAVGRRE